MLRVEGGGWRVDLLLGRIRPACFLTALLGRCSGGSGSECRWRKRGRGNRSGQRRLGGGRQGAFAREPSQVGRHSHVLVSGREFEVRGLGFDFGVAILCLVLGVEAMGFR